jgi:methyl-accepting chemotaxis protein
MIDHIRRSIRNKLLAITGLGTALVLAASLFGIWQAWGSINNLQSVMNHEVANQARLVALSSRFKTQVIEWKNLLLRGGDSELRDRHWEKFLALDEEIQQEAAAIEASIERPEVKWLIVDFRDKHRQIKAEYTTALKTFGGSSFGGFNGVVVNDAVMGLADEAVTVLDNASGLLMEEAQLDAQLAQENAAASTAGALAAIAIAVVVAFLLFLVLVERSIIRPARRVAADLDHLAKGDFSQPVEQTTHDELGQVAASAGQIQQRLGKTLRQVTDSVAQVASAAEELAAISEQTTQGVNQQRGETDQVATAMNEMTATVQEVARNAAEAAHAAEQADGASRNGQKVVNSSVRAIGELAKDVEHAAEVIQRLEADSASIGTVLDVIRGVAEQTNLLALNAAIEAARAGEQGRGFAVVADEVRTLALRTQQSTQEIHGMIERIQAGTAETVRVMDAGRNRARQAVGEAAAAGEALEVIARAVGSIRDMNAQIASASEEQNSVAEEMNRSIINISGVSEQSAEGAGQTTRASEELARLAADLQGTVRQFKLR